MMTSMLKKKLWITRDGKGEYSEELYFWKKRPKWDHTEQVYNCSNDVKMDNDNSTVVANMSLDCDDLARILDACGIPIGRLKNGQIAEIELKTTVALSKSLAEKSKELSKRIKSTKKPSQKEILEFLKELEYEKDDDEDDDDDDENEDEDEEDLV